MYRGPVIAGGDVAKFCSVAILMMLLVPAAVRADDLTLRDVIELRRAGLGEDVLLAVIEADGGAFALSYADIMDLKGEGFSERLIAALVRTGADAGCCLGVDDGLEHPAEQPAHELAAVGGAKHLDHLEQGRIVEGHRVESLSVRSLVGSHRASRGGPSTSVTDTNQVTIKGRSYTTPRDSGWIVTGVACCSAGPGSDLSEELAAGVGPAALDSVVAPECPPGPASRCCWSRTSWW